MSPTVRHGGRPRTDPSIVVAPASTRAATVYACALLTVALALVVGIAVRAAHCNLLLANGSAREQQIRDVGACDQQHKAHCAQEHVECGAHGTG